MMVLIVILLAPYDSLCIGKNNHKRIKEHSLLTTFHSSNLLKSRVDLKNDSGLLIGAYLALYKHWNTFPVAWCIGFHPSLWSRHSLFSGLHFHNFG